MKIIMNCMTFHVQLLNYYTMFWDGGHVEWGQYRPNSMLALEPATLSH